MDIEDFLDAIVKGDLVAVKEYVNNGNAIDVIIDRPEGQITPLMAAISGINFEVVDFLLTNKASPNFGVIDNFGRLLSPLQYIVDRYIGDAGARELLCQYAQSLLASGATVDIEYDSKTTPLMRLSMSMKEVCKTLNLVQILLQYGADVTKKNVWNYSAPAFAVLAGNESLVDLYLQKEGAFPDNIALFEIIRKSSDHGSEGYVVSPEHINIFRKILSKYPKLIEMKASGIRNINDDMTLSSYAEFRRQQGVVELINEITESKNKTKLGSQGQDSLRSSNNARALYALGFVLLAGTAVISYFAPQATGLGSILGYAIGAWTMAACAAASVLKAGSVHSHDVPLVFSDEMKVVPTSPSLMSKQTVESKSINNNNNNQQSNRNTLGRIRSLF